ncbi:MAG TPA: ABC-2 transporter permease [Woeseiaceae bacterium]|nr:ABC-2 transporter permease [Woeseiaceae bacterium]
MIRRAYFLMQRELWEHRALYLTPLVIAFIVVLGVATALVTGGGRIVGFENMVAGMQLGGQVGSVAGVTALAVGPSTVFVVGLAFLVFFYSIDALYAERKDRSILFWKSLPLTDTEVVLSKLATAALVAPVITFGFVAATHVVILCLSTVAVWVGGGSAWELVWRPVPLLQIWVLSVYLLIGAALWFLPYIAWGLFCSAFAKKNVFLWAVLPFVVTPLVERLLFDTNLFAKFALGRLSYMQWIKASFSGENLHIAFGDMPGRLTGDVNLLSLVDPGKFLSTPGLWGGLVVAAGFTAGAIYFRRYRDETANG